MRHATLASLSLLLAACGELDLAAGPLLHDVTFATEEITPNADGDNDVVEIRYSLRRPAAVSIYFDDSNGARYYFRTARRRARLAVDADLEPGGGPQAATQAGSRHRIAASRSRHRCVYKL